MIFRDIRQHVLWRFLTFTINDEDFLLPMKFAQSHSTVFEVQTSIDNSFISKSGSFEFFHFVGQRKWVLSVLLYYFWKYSYKKQQ